jgi:hypothetical protein
LKVPHSHSADGKAHAAPSVNLTKRRLPPLSDHDVDRLSRLISDGHLIPALNNTKWAELIEEMLHAGAMKPQFRTRSVFAPLGFVTEWDGEWYYHIHPVAELEWVELRAASPEWLIATLRKHSIPFSEEEQGVPRVWGYTRPGPQPCWK